jgi:ankyrin repeat protein
VSEKLEAMITDDETRKKFCFALFSNRYEYDASNIKGKLMELHSKGFNLNIRDSNDNTLLHVVLAKYCNTDNSHYEFLQWLITLGIDINHRNNKGYTALHVSKDNDNEVKCISLLLGAGADWNIKNNNGVNCECYEHYSVTKPSKPTLTEREIADLQARLKVSETKLAAVEGKLKMLSALVG